MREVFDYDFVQFFWPVCRLWCQLAILWELEKDLLDLCVSLRSHGRSSRIYSGRLADPRVSDLARS